MRRSPALAAAVLALALGGTACGSSDDGAAASTTTTSTTEAPPLTGTIQPQTLEQQKSVISLAPVLSAAPCAAADPPAEGPVSTDTTVPAPGSERTPDRDGAQCYELGPTAADGNDLTAAEVIDDEAGGGYGVQVSAAPGSVDALAGLLDGCFAGAPTCPAQEGGVGYVAVVHLGAVVSAPAVQAAGLAQAPIQIVGSFSEAEANELAELLNRTS